MNPTRSKTAPPHGKGSDDDPPDVDAADLVELGEFCGFLHDWLTTDRDTLERSLHRFSFGLIPIEEITADLARYAATFDPNGPGNRIEAR